MPHTTGYRHLIGLMQQARRLNLKEAGRPAPVLQSPSRRTFLKTTAMSGVALGAGGTLSACGAGRHKVVVVGGGLAGLNASYQLGKLGIRAQVYEARTRVGGRIRSVLGAVSEGVVSDLGAELVNTDHDDLRAIMDELGVPLLPRKPDSSELDLVGYFFAGQRRSEAEMAQALQPLAQQITDDAALLDEDWDTWCPHFDQLSIADYLDLHSDKIPADPNIRSLIEGLSRVEYGVEASESSALQLLYMLPVVDGESVELLSTSDEAWVIGGGSESVIHALKNVLKGQIHTGKALSSLKQTRQGYTLTFNGDQTVYARYVVLALPLPALRKVELDLELPDTLQRFINEVDLGRNEKIIAGVDQRIWRNENGFRNEGWSDEAVDLIWDSSLRELESRDNGALTFFIGGNQVEATAIGSAEEQGAALVGGFDALLPGLQASANGRYIRTAWHKTAGINGGYTSLKPGQYSEFASEWMYVESDDPEEAVNVQVDRLVFAGEHTSDEYYGFMNGAAQSGRLAAQWIVQDIAAAATEEEEESEAAEEVTA